jgi:hypothetical protein
MARLVLALVTTGWLVLAASAFAVAAGKGESTPHYRLKARVDPARHRIEAEAWIQAPPAPTCYLYKGLVVRHASVDGKEATFHYDEAAEPLPYVPAARAVVVEAAAPRQLLLAYEGEIRETINGVNMLAPDLVELASYSAWYPAFRGLANFTFEMEVETPAGFMVTTNGVLKERREEGERIVTVWESCGPGFDMVLLGSPELRALQAVAGDVQVEVYYSHLPAKFVGAMRDGLLEGMKRLSQAYGPLAGKSLLRFVSSPRGGWGYSRAPLFVVSEAYAEGELGKAHGEARQFHGCAHEMAHFWWLVAPTDTPDDWLNEGLAEYSAFRLSEARDPAFAPVLRQEYEEHAAASQTAATIADTEASSPDRYVNRYEKTTLMFLEARRRFGEKALDKMLRAFHTRFADRRDATTALFLDEVRAEMGAEAEAFFRDTLNRKGVIRPQP